MKISPIFYMGNKKKLINKGLIELFPKNINGMIDLFGGSSVISLNTQANKYIINDLDSNLCKLYKLFATFSSEEIINHINSRIDEYGLARERTRRIDFKDDKKLEEYKKSYIEFRKYYNENKNILDFYTLMFYSFSQQFRFNSKGEFNMPCGTDCFSKLNEEYIRNGCDFFTNKKVTITNNDFRKLKIDKLNKNDFVYLDPPYINTTATYNENGGWNIHDESDLHKLCEELNKNNIKFGLSNVFYNKGIQNKQLIKWCEEKNWNVYMFDRVSYSACGKGNSNAKEVLITNYNKGV